MPGKTRYCNSGLEFIGILRIFEIPKHAPCTLSKTIDRIIPISKTMDRIFPRGQDKHPDVAAERVGWQELTAERNGLARGAWGSRNNPTRSYNYLWMPEQRLWRIFMTQGPGL